MEGEEPVEAPPIEVVETQATQQKEEVDDDADDPFESKCYSLGDRNAALVCIPERDFSFAARLWERYVEREKQAAKKRQHEEKKAKEKAARDEKLRKKDPVAADKKRAREEAKSESKKKPRTSGTVGIIIVPNAPTALLTLVNAADLLERNTYVTPAQKRQQGAKKEPVVKVSRTRGDGVVQSFKLVDDPRRLSDSDWKKVVAVVAQGAAWQFKGWKVSQPVDLFQQVAWACTSSTTTARRPRTSKSGTCRWSPSTNTSATSTRRRRTCSGGWSTTTSRGGRRRRPARRRRGAEGALVGGGGGCFLVDARPPPGANVLPALPVAPGPVVSARSPP